MIRAATPSDAESIAQIYDHYVRNTTITFEEEPVTPGDIAARMGRVEAANLPYLVTTEADRVVGYAYAGRWHERSAYRYSVETSIYLDAERVGQGRGAPLYRVLLEQLRARGLHAAIGGIALPNPESIALHEKLGFQRAAHYREVGFKLGRWIDVGYWQCLL